MILPTITKKQIEILLLIYQFRFLDRIQIQTILNHKDYKRINAWLKDLVDKGYINRIYVTTTPWERIIPSKFYMGKNGIKYLRKYHTELRVRVVTTVLKKLRREKDKSDSFKDHSLFLVDLYIMYLKRALEREGTVKFLTKINLEPYEDLKELACDVLVIEKDRHNKAKRYFIEVFKPKTPRFMIRHRIRKYIAYFQEKTWEENYNFASPTVLFIAPKEKKMDRYTFNYTKRILDEEGVDYDDISITVTSVDKVKQAGITDSYIWRWINNENEYYEERGRDDE